MTTITAKIIADSISPEKIRLTTMLLRYPRFIHAELMTHRVFSRNASSSRAIPVEKQINAILEDTAMPIFWGKNQPGLQAYEESNEEICIFHSPVGKDEFCSREEAWIMARDRAIEMAMAFHKAGYHKQIVNRLLEPFSHISVVATSIYWKNWFKLRDHEMAMPEIGHIKPDILGLAPIMRQAFNESKPQELEPGQWHLPFISLDDWSNHPESHLIKASVARCARTSYLTTEGKEPDVDADLQLYDRLVGSEPLHASPAEHQATPDEYLFQSKGIWQFPKQHGNLYGWRQYRKMLKGEFANDYETI